MIKIKEFKDFGIGMCVVLVSDQQEYRLNRENLALKITNLEASGYDASVERDALLHMDKEIS